MRITVHAKPGAREEKIEKMGENRYKIWVKEPAEKNKANLASVKILAKYFQVPESSIKLLGGAKSKRKVFEISNSLQNEKS